MRATSTVAIADPPYQSWQTRPIGDVVPGPNLIEQGDALYAIGRQHLRGADGTIADRRTSIWRIDGRRAHVLDLPSSGDTSYCGVVERDDGTVLISYYSQHEVAYGRSTTPTPTTSTWHRSACSRRSIPAEGYQISVRSIRIGRPVRPAVQATVIRSACSPEARNTPSSSTYWCTTRRSVSTIQYSATPDFW